MTVRPFDVKPLRGAWHLAPNPFSARYIPGGDGRLYARALIGCLPGGAGHGGRDIDADSEDRILRAVWDGTIHRYPWDDFGNHIGLINSDNHEFMYAHAASIHVSDGQAVKADADLGILGSTGNTTGPHCHGELRLRPTQWCSAIDPTNHLLAEPPPAPQPQEEEMILFKASPNTTIFQLVAPGFRSIVTAHQYKTLVDTLGAAAPVPKMLPSTHEWYTYKVVDLSKITS